jgi:hypothetical protein
VPVTDARGQVLKEPKKPGPGNKRAIVFMTSHKPGTSLQK